MKRQSTSAQRRLEDWRKRERDRVDALQRDVELFHDIVGGVNLPRPIRVVNMRFKHVGRQPGRATPLKGKVDETLPGSAGSPGAGER
jgi:hypothetical protein